MKVACVPIVGLLPRLDYDVPSAFDVDVTGLDWTDGARW